MFDDSDISKGDDEQVSKELETLQLLVSAGYFRARIKGLTTFDKVIGGMTWCIQGCKMNIDIDLFFQENANIGKKIALTEKIVRVLKRMRCPHRIEPHQIQGSDFIHIYPVVQWLVKQTLGKQDERMADMKVLACQYFDRNCKFSDKSNELKKEETWTCNIYPMHNCTNIVDYLNCAYWPQRRYRKPDSMKSASEDVCVVSTLLEYGKKEIMTSFSGSSTRDKERTGSSSSVKDVMDVDNLQNQMSSQVKETNRVAGKLISRLIELNIGDVQEAVQDYEAKSTQLLQSNQMLNAKKPENINRAIVDIEGEIDVMKQSMEETLSQISEVEELIKPLQKEVDDYKSTIKEINDKISENIKNCPPDIDINEVQSMVERLDQLKEEERRVKATFKDENEELVQKLAKLQNEEEQIEDEEKVAQMKEEFAREKKRLQNGRLRLANKTREVKQMELFLDNIPSKREIQQYQKRFVELNDQINIAFAENKQLFDMYNIQDSVKDCLQREVNLLNSIYDNFKESMQNSSAKEQMIKQMEQVANTIRDLKRNGENQTEKTKAERDKRKEEYNLIVEKNREYAKITKQLQETWQCYNELVQNCQELGIDVSNE